MAVVLIETVKVRKPGSHRFMRVAKADAKKYEPWTEEDEADLIRIPDVVDATDKKAIQANLKSVASGRTRIINCPVKPAGQSPAEPDEPAASVDFSHGIIADHIRLPVISLRKVLEATDNIEFLQAIRQAEAERTDITSRVTALRAITERIAQVQDNRA